MITPNTLAARFREIIGDAVLAQELAETALGAIASDIDRMLMTPADRGMHAVYSLQAVDEAPACFIACEPTAILQIIEKARMRGLHEA